MISIHIDKLRLRTILGVYDWEREQRQDVVISLWLEVEGDRAVTSDALEDTCDYKALTKRVISHVESSSYLLVERMAGAILELALDTPRVSEARVRVEKPHALRFADNVALEVRGTRGDR